MKTRALFLSVLASAGVLVAGWQLGAQPAALPTAQGTSGTTTTTPDSATTTPDTSGGPATDPGGTATSGGGGSSTSGTFTGSTDSNRYGTIQVTVKVSGGKITDVTAAMSANDRRSESINSQAEPLLRSEVLQAQSANVNMIGGATYTSQSYLTSLQAALDKAGL